MNKIVIFCISVFYSVCSMAANAPDASGSQKTAIYSSVSKADLNKNPVDKKHPVEQKQTNQQMKYASLQNNESLQEVVNNLSDKDRKIVLEIQQEISTWPKDMLAELENYREFILNARKEAEKKYNALSAQAKRALLIEKDMKSKLSSGAVKSLESAHTK